MEIIGSTIVGTSCQPEANALFSPKVLEQTIFPQLTPLSGHITRITSADADLFRGYFQQEAVCYANSWLYILRSTRGDQGDFGYKFVSEDTIIGIGYRNAVLYLVHPMGAGRFTTTLDLCYQLCQSAPCPIILKKVDQRLYEHLYASNLIQEQAGYATHLEEEAFPEHTLYLETLYEQNFQTDPRSLPLMRKVKRLAKSPMKLQARTDLLSLEKLPGFQALFGSNREKYRSYLHIIEEVSAHNTDEGKYKTCVYTDEEGTLHGLYISERLADESMGLYCAVSSRAHPGITEWMDYDFFHQLFLAGIRFVYLGGSETEGVHSYVQKLLPLTPVYLMRPMEIYSHLEY